MKGGNLYDKKKSKNPLIRYVNKKLYRDVAKFLFPLSKRILDIGCGEGYFIEYLTQFIEPNSYIEGSDISEEILEIAKENNPTINFKQSSIYNSIYKDESFDYVVAMEVLEHLDNPESALSELKRISKKIVIITVPREPIFRIANVLRLKYLKRIGNTPGHVNNWTKSLFRKFLSKHFDNITIKTSSFWLIGVCKN